MQLHSNTHSFIAVSGVATPEKKRNSLALSSISKKIDKMCRRPSYERFLEECSSPFMRLAEHLTLLRAWCKQHVCLDDENPTCSVPA